MIDIRDIGRDFMPRQRPEEEFAPQGMPQAPGGGMQFGGQPMVGYEGSKAPPGFDPYMGRTTADPWVGGGQQPFGVPPTAPPGGGQVSTGQPQPFAPIGGQPPGGAGGGGLGGGTQSLLGGGWRDPAGGFQPGVPGSTAFPTDTPSLVEQRQQTFGIGGAPAAGGGGFPYPEQWQTATDIYGQLAGGMPGMTPEYAQQAWLPYQRQAEQASMQAREQAGLSGLRWSSPLAGQLEETWAGAGERFGSEMEQMRMQDIQGQRAAMLGAAGGLGGLGGQYAQLPGQLAGQALGMGQAYQGMQQQEYDKMLQEFMRTQPEYSPYLPYMQQGAQVPYGPQTYQPGFASNMMDIGGMMGMYGQMNPQGQNQSWLTRPW